MNFIHLLRTLMVLTAILWGSLASQAAMNPFRIVIESSAPYYEPGHASVAAGLPILWVNPTPSHHTVTHDGCLAEGPCSFDSGPLAPDQHFTVAGLPPGRYSYHCRLHPIMRATLVVIDPITPSQT